MIEIGKMDSHSSNFTFKTKSETLSDLLGRVTLSVVPALYLFSKAQWDDDSGLILQDIHQKFQGENVAVRSSALAEDSFDSSMAGAF